METLKEVLIRRDGISEAEAKELIASARARMWDGEDPEDILFEDFGLEPDYIFDLLGD